MDPAQEKRKSDQDKIKGQQEAAANIVRHKLVHLYGEEPGAKEELKEVTKLKTEHVRLSKHQKFMDDLSKSGRSLAEIQKAWHDYYQKLPTTRNIAFGRSFITSTPKNAQEPSKKY